MEEPLLLVERENALKLDALLPGKLEQPIPYRRGDVFHADILRWSLTGPSCRSAREYSITLSMSFCDWPR